ncbi:hypothetical protein BDP55DRAFT_686270 [Colletotrichum godetiae]|uniref:Hydrophobin n=1 Tax=Colletotrichum godetiae TaxID=1209918 RepID=A0AAJ0A7F1_9PEZI|nr:uncharacterized protein BDP55DRAFT_686270 [Colletotrichum godetiae]KAK1657263.1 hypothetical protein BDP55DRAFT_686270 [Colletotrichum godetiae]
MKAAIVSFGLFSSLAIAAPTTPVDSPLVERLSILAPVCQGTTPLCCSSDVVGGVLSSNCVAPVTTPVTTLGFQAACLLDGNRLARCCTLTVAGLAILCKAPGT